jgi:hypothetical protein
VLEDIKVRCLHVNLKVTNLNPIQYNRQVLISASHMLKLAIHACTEVKPVHF